jgi:hypothetical protein
LDWGLGPHGRIKELWMRWRGWQRHRKTSFLLSIY